MKHLIKLAFLIVILPVGNASAALVTYGLNLNNIGLSTGTDYATVTIRDDEEAGVGAGLIQFEVKANNAFFDEGLNFGIQAFYFNTSLPSLSGIMVSNDPAGPGWSLDFDLNAGIEPSDNGTNVSEFGRFEVEYKGSGQVRRDPLKFTLELAGDDIFSYALNNADGFAFAAHIADFTNFSSVASLTGAPESGWFAGSVNPVPVPAAFWLFGTALIGFIGIARTTRV